MVLCVCVSWVFVYQNIAAVLPILIATVTGEYDVIIPVLAIGWCCALEIMESD